MAKIKFPRSVFNLSCKKVMTLAPNMITPIYKKRVQAGETMSLVNNHFCRFNNLLVPVYQDIKVSLYSFYVRDRDVYDYAANVYGEVASDRTKDIVYRMPYVVSSLLPWYHSRDDSISMLVPLNSSESNPGPFQNNVLSDASGRVLLNLSNFQQQDKENAANALFMYPAQFTQNGKKFNVPPSLNSQEFWRYQNNNSANVNIARALQVNDGLDVWRPCGLADYLYGVVGVKYLAMPALPALGYYKIFDDYFRPADLIDPLFAVDRQHEKAITRSYLKQKFIDVLNSHGTYPANFGILRSVMLDESVALCDTWNEEQIGLSIVMASSPSYISGHTDFNIGSEYTEMLTQSAYTFKYFLMRTGGLCPAFKYSDYFGLGGLEPTEFTFNVVSGISKVALEDNGAYDYTLHATAGKLDVVDSNGGLVVASDEVMLSSTETIHEFIAKCKLQQFMDLSHLAGTRYFELLKTYSGVEIPDNQLGRPVLLSMASNDFDIIPVVQTSGSQQGSTPQGTLTANGVCRLSGAGFFKTFPEHGYVFVLAVPRVINIYQEKIDRNDLIFERLDYPYPLFAKLGEQPIYNAEIHIPKSVRAIHQFQKGSDRFFIDQPDFTFTPGANVFTPKSIVQYEINDRFKPFAYQERYANLKYSNNSVHGLFRSRCALMTSCNPDFQTLTSYSKINIGSSDAEVRNYGCSSMESGSLDYWHYAINYDTEMIYRPDYTVLPAQTLYYIDAKNVADLGIVNPTTTYTTVDSWSSALSKQPYFSIQSVQPPFNWTFLLSTAPWRRSSVVSKQQPLEMLCNFTVKSIVPYPVSVKPGQNLV